MSYALRRQILTWSGATLALIDLVLVSAGLLRYPTILDTGAAMAFSVVVLLIGCGLGGIAVVRWLAPNQLISVSKANLYGLLCGVWMIVLLSVELFTVWLSYLPRSPIALWPFGVMLLIFVLAGYHGAQDMPKLGSGIITAGVCAMLGGLILVAYGLIVDFAAHDTLEQILRSDFRQSGMQDLSSYVLYNTLDGASSHLFLMPVMGVLFGLVGEAFARARNQMTGHRAV